MMNVIFSLHYLPYSIALPEFLSPVYSTKYFEVAHPISLLRDSTSL